MARDITVDNSPQSPVPDEENDDGSDSDDLVCRSPDPRALLSGHNHRPYIDPDHATPRGFMTRGTYDHLQRLHQSDNGHYTHHLYPSDNDCRTQHLYPSDNGQSHLSNHLEDHTDRGYPQHLPEFTFHGRS
ncbi:hypothetical protein J6590_035621 [Homalodisca vitripennis]|nr:hypothetical protein J6590_035621 [Homalodisca vitripennis]